MEILRKLVKQTIAHLSDLTRSQRMALGLCALIVAASLVALVSWTASRSYVPLPLHELSAEDIGDVETALKRLAVDYRIEGEQVLVPPQQRTQILGQLMELESFQGRVTIDFARLIESDSPWMSENEKQWRRTVALGGELSRTIASMSGIKSARVFIDNTMRRGFGGRSVPPSAVVSVWPEPGFPIGKKRVNMLASLVSGAVAGLDMTKVKIVDESAGRSYTPSGPDDAMASDLLEMRRSEEEHYERKIQDRLSYIPGVLASVFAEQDTNETQTQKTSLDKPVVSKSRSETTTENRGLAAAEPGTRPNVGATLASSGRIETKETESSEDEFMGERGRETTSTRNTRGVIIKLTATIGVPRSWLIQTYKKMNRTEEDPADETALQEIEEREFPKIAAAVSQIINAESGEQVAVSSFPDFAPVEMEAGAAAQAGTQPMMARLGTRVPEIALISLAAFSLMAMLLMVRKASDGSKLEKEKAAPTGPSFELPAPMEVPTVTGGVGGESGVLVGHELDSEQLQSAQVAEQVGKMVNDNPSQAADLVQRWMNEPAK